MSPSRLELETSRGLSQHRPTLSNLCSSYSKRHYFFFFEFALSACNTGANELESIRRSRMKHNPRALAERRLAVTTGTGERNLCHGFQADVSRSPFSPRLWRPTKEDAVEHFPPSSRRTDVRNSTRVLASRRPNGREKSSQAMWDLGAAQHGVHPSSTETLSNPIPQG